jgi:prophage regulatory protein
MTSTENTMTSRLVSPNEAAFMTTMSKTLLRQMSLEGQFPSPLQIGVKRIAYVRAEVEAFIDGRIAARALAD